jgi:hypothetical protein
LEGPSKSANGTSKFETSASTFEREPCKVESGHSKSGRCAFNVGSFAIKLRRTPFECGSKRSKFVREPSNFGSELSKFEKSGPSKFGRFLFQI